MRGVEGRVQGLFSTGSVEALFAGQWEWVIHGALRHLCLRSISKTRHIVTFTLDAGYRAHRGIVLTAQTLHP